MERLNLLIQGYIAPGLKSSLQNFYGCHHDLVDCYKISVSHMTMEVFTLQKHLDLPWFFVGSVLLVFLVFCAVFLCCICLYPVSCDPMLPGSLNCSLLIANKHIREILIICKQFPGDRKWSNIYMLNFYK